MPRGEQGKTNVQRAREYVKANGLTYDAAYWLMDSAIRADGNSPRHASAETGIIAEANLSAEDRAALVAARTALGF